MKSELVATTFIGGPLCGGAAFTGIVVWSPGGCAFFWVRTGFLLGCASFQWRSWSVGSLLAQVSPGCENLFLREGIRSLQQRDAPNRVPERRIEFKPLLMIPHEKCWRLCYNCANFVCSVTRSTTAERTNVQNDLRLEMALESMWICLCS